MSSALKQGFVARLGLDTTDLGEIKYLAQVCNKYEGLDMKLNWNILCNRPQNELNDFLYYVDGQLVGFLALFSFNLQEGEISGMVHPAYRRRGIFSILLKAASQECRRRNLPKLLLIVEQASPAGQAFVQHLSTTYHHSEYKMVLEEPRLTNTLSNQRLHIRPTCLEDLQVLSHITALAFAMPEKDVDWYSEDTLSQADHRYYVGEIDGIVIGKIDVSLSEDAGLIFGFAVLPEYQGQGYGRQILAHAVSEILSGGQQNIWLEVLTDSKRALLLYQSCGFKETGCYDYYLIS